ncbi:MAG: MFS transporter [Thermoleophilia bacterium]|nr:MFS transporter [Thermoleophilia bacterium]
MTLPRGFLAAWISLAVICFAIFLAALNQTAVSTLLPAIIQDYEGAFSPTAVERAGWIITAYLIGYTVVMPVMGRVADLLGHRFLFNISIAIFIAGSVLCAVSPGLRVLAFFRAIQAVGGGAIVPIAMGIVGATFTRRHQAMAIGLLVAASEAGGVIGPPFGAYIAEPFGWRWIFWINVPLGIGVMILVWRLVARGTRRQVSIDYRGAVLLAMALTFVTVGLSGQRAVGWYEFTLPLILAGAVSLVMFISTERGQKHPTVRLGMFRNVSFSAANFANMLEGVAMITALVQVPFFAYATRGATPIEGGLLVIRMTVMIPAGAIAAGFLINRLSHRYTAATGFVMAAVGLFLISRWPQDVSTAVQTRDLLITGFGFGFNSPALAAAVIGSVTRARLAAGSAIHIVAKMAGEMIGLAALSGWGIYTFESQLDLRGLPFLEGRQRLEEVIAERSIEAILVVLNRFFLVAALMCALAIIPALMIRIREVDEPDETINSSV